jgi:tetratricopeptide (TPR) repeat protein
MSPVVSGVVSVDRLEVPVEARGNFSEACAAVQKKDLPEARKDLNRALKLSPKFAAAWVLLGQIQKDQGKMEQAEQSCTQAHDADASYLPAYLCLADLAARQENWTQAADLTNQALDLHPVRAPGAYYYNSLAYFYLGQTPLAEKSALRALEDERAEHKPPLHWLLAKIYEAKGDRAAEADQLRVYLKLAPHAHDSETARHILREIESRGTSSSTTAKVPAQNR